MYELLHGGLVFRHSSGRLIHYRGEDKIGLLWDATENILFCHGGEQQVARRLRDYQKDFTEIGVDASFLRVLFIPVVHINEEIIKCLNKYISTSSSIASIEDDLARIQPNHPERIGYA